MIDMPQKNMHRLDLLSLARGYQGPLILAAAADLQLFDVVSKSGTTSQTIARKLACAERGIVVLLDALVALGVLSKRRQYYHLQSSMGRLLNSRGPDSILAMLQHQSNCARNWVQLARVVKTASVARHSASVRGIQADRSAFVGAMHCGYADEAPEVVRRLCELPFRHVLDLGGASGTWTIALLQCCRRARATIVDRPCVIPMCRRRVVSSGLANRVKLLGGDFRRLRLPHGVDLVWLSAVIHEYSRPENLAIYRRAYRCLTTGGRIAIRDVVMEPQRRGPGFGALVAANMLVETQGGGTFTLEEIGDDLRSAGFKCVKLLHRDRGMNSVITAIKRD